MDCPDSIWPSRADKAVRSTGTLVRGEVEENLIVKQPARINAGWFVRGGALTTKRRDYVRARTTYKARAPMTGATSRARILSSHLLLRVGEWKRDESGAIHRKIVI